MIKIKIIALLSITLLTLSACFSTNDDLADAKKLIVSQPCLPVENNCEILLNNNIKLHLQFKAPPSYQRLLPITLKTTEATLENISISLRIDGKEMPSEKMRAREDKKVWEAQLLPFATVTKDNIKVRLTVSYKGILHFAEFPALY